MRYYVTIGDETLEVDLSGSAPLVNGREVHAELLARWGPVRHLRVDGRTVRLAAARRDRPGEWDLLLGGEHVVAVVVDERTRAIREMTGSAAPGPEKRMVAPMPGLILRVEAGPGDTVKAGQPVITIEAMKMENDLRAPADGIVASVSVTEGQTVDRGTVLLVLQ